MAPSFIASLMSSSNANADKTVFARGGLAFPTLSSMDDTDTNTDAETDANGLTFGSLPLVGGAKAEGLQFGLPLGGFPRQAPFKRPARSHTASMDDISTVASSPTSSTSSSNWNDHQKVQDFFRHTDAPAEKAAQSDHKFIDVRGLVEPEPSPVFKSDSQEEDASRRSLRKDLMAKRSYSVDLTERRKESTFLDGGRRSALADMLAKRSGSVDAVESQQEDTPMDGSRHSVLSSMLANRTSGIDMAKNQEEDVTVDSSRHSALTDMLANRTNSVDVAENQQEDEAMDGGRRSALSDMLAKRSGSVDAVESQEEDKPVDGSRHNALSAMLASRNGSVDVAKSQEEDVTMNEGRRSGLSDMLARRSGSVDAVESQSTAASMTVMRNRRRSIRTESISDVADFLVDESGMDSDSDSDSDLGLNGDTLLELLSARHIPVRAPPSDSESEPDSDAEELEKERLSRRSLAPNPLNDMLAKRTAPSVSPVTPMATRNRSNATALPTRSDMMSEMLAKRTAPAVSESEGADSNPKKINPLEAMLSQRSGASAPSEEKSADAANPLAAMLQRRQAPVGTATETEKPSLTVTTASPDADKQQTPLKEHPTYAQYFKMLKVGLPPPVVKHKMQRDNVDPSVLDLDPDQPLPEPSQASAAAGSLSPEAEAKYQEQLKQYEAKHGKYLQMVKVGLPPSVVEHKMRMDGVDPEWLNGPPQRPSAEPKTEISEEERAAHRQKYHKYFQMLRMGLPRGAVEQKMKLAGLDPKELDGPRTSTTPKETATPRKTLKRKDSIRKKLHWEVKKHDVHRDSLWGATASTEALSEVQISAESRELLEKLFVKTLTETKKRNAADESQGEAAAKKKKAMVQLLDMKKSQNIAITLARVKLSFSELKRELLAMNPTVLSTSQVQSLLDMWPDRQELAAVLAYQGDMAAVGAAEKFLMEVGRVPRFCEKLECLMFKQDFPSRVQELRESLELVIRGVDQVCSSSELRQLFIYILQIGNLLNFGNDADGAAAVEGFALGSLVKFSQTKAFVGGITFLQYVVQSIERDVPHLARFYDQIDLIGKCSKVSFHALTSEKKALEAGWKKLVRESELNEQAGSPEDSLQRFCKEVEGELQEVQSLLDQLTAAKQRFLEYFEEDETGEELDVLLSHIAGFTAEYHREHQKYLTNMKNDVMGLYSKFSPSKNKPPAEPKQSPQKETKVVHKVHKIQPHHGKHSTHHHNCRQPRHKGEPHGPRQRSHMPPQPEHPQPHRFLHQARVLHLEIPTDEDMDEVSSTASMSPKMCAALSSSP